ncbi:hypothetical protein [Streptacidiphilus neutrinimicus]|uniref:hypothetical protein n=1 Tax=Streptacidiphilus neutrinimicus TaxID=105420 RepID=UPI0007C852F4|nr:hypothetical protein [Streptacidiphilus neutrinimicus]
MNDRSTAQSWVRAWAAVLCLAVAWIHVQDQGGFPGDKSPGYVGVGYYLLEAAGVLSAVVLTSRSELGERALVWVIAAGVAVGPLLGFVLSRGPGLPNYDDDRGNWTEPLGLVSVAVEVVLLTLAALRLRALLRRDGAAQHALSSGRSAVRATDSAAP